MLLLSHVNPSANLKVAEGSLIDLKTRLSPLLPWLQRGDKDGASIMGGVIEGGKGVQRALQPAMLQSTLHPTFFLDHAPLIP